MYQRLFALQFHKQKGVHLTRFNDPEFRFDGSDEFKGSAVEQKSHEMSGISCNQFLRNDVELCHFALPIIIR